MHLHPSIRSHPDSRVAFLNVGVPRAEVTGKVWSTRWCYRRKGPKQVRARFVVRQFAKSLDANFYSPTLELEVKRVLLGLYEYNHKVWCLERASNGLRDASRLFHEHFAAVLTSRLGFTRSEAQPTLFVDLARNVFIAVHFDDLIMVGSSSLLSEVVGVMKQYFTMKVSHPL